MNLFYHSYIIVFLFLCVLQYATVTEPKLSYNINKVSQIISQLYTHPPRYLHCLKKKVINESLKLVSNSVYQLVSDSVCWSVSLTSVGYQLVS